MTVCCSGMPLFRSALWPPTSHLCCRAAFALGRLSGSLQSRRDNAFLTCDHVGNDSRTLGYPCEVRLAYWQSFRQLMMSIDADKKIAQGEIRSEGLEPRHEDFLLFYKISH